MLLMHKIEASLLQNIDKYPHLHIYSLAYDWPEVTDGPWPPLSTWAILKFHNHFLDEHNCLQKDNKSGLVERLGIVSFINNSSYYCIGWPITLCGR